jgi:integrase
VAGWRNWQTQTAQNRPTARSWGFKSLARYHHHRFHSSGASGSFFPASRASSAADICNHSFRATGITVYLSNGGSVEKAQQRANHSDPRTTKLYDRRRDEVSLDEVERILI